MNTFYWSQNYTGAVATPYIIPNYRADAWTYDQTQAQAAVPNGGFVYPRHYMGASMSITGLGGWGSGMTFSNMVWAGIPLKNSASSLIAVNRFSGGTPYEPGSVAGQRPGIYLVGSEDSLTNTVEIQSILMHATQSDNYKAIYYQNPYSTATLAVSFTNAFNDANYSIIIPYGRSSNLTTAMDGWYISGKSTTGFTINRGGMDATFYGGIIAVKSGTNNDYFKNGIVTPSAGTTAISFTTPFANASYAVFITFEASTTPGTSYIYGHTSQTANGFNLHVSSTMYVKMSWTAVKLNYTDFPDGIII